MHAMARLARLLAERYDAREAQTIARWAAEDILGKNVFDPPEAFRTAWENACEQLVAGVPLAYVTGKSNFYGIDFWVTPDVLIPRPETEELVEWVVSEWADRPACSVLDVGTGSGCIAVMLQRLLPEARVSALDVSEAALHVARTNAARLSPGIFFWEKNFLTEKLPEPVDVLVSNPPYVATTESEQLAAHVLEHEPHLALFAPQQDPLIFYRRLAEVAQTQLLPGGAVYAEINALRAADTLAVFRDAGFEATLREDLSGRPRMISARRGGDYR